MTTEEISNQRAPRVLLLDDDIGLLRMLSLCLRLEGFDVVSKGNGALGLEALSSAEYDLVVLDLQMPVMDGRTFYREMRDLGYEQPVVILSAYGAEKARIELNAQAAIQKPFEPEILASIARAVLEKVSLSAHG